MILMQFPCDGVVRMSMRCIVSHEVSGVYDIVASWSLVRSWLTDPGPLGTGTILPRKLELNSLKETVPAT